MATAYRSIFESKRSFYRDVWIDKEWQGQWRFIEGENADHVVRAFAERKFGSGSGKTVIVGDRNSKKPLMWESYGVEKPHDLA